MVDVELLGHGIKEITGQPWITLLLIVTENTSLQMPPSRAEQCTTALFLLRCCWALACNFQNLACLLTQLTNELAAPACTAETAKSRTSLQNVVIAWQVRLQSLAQDKALE